MFQSGVYKNRREGLCSELKKGTVLLPANQMLPFNYAQNPLPFRQDSSFLYYCGIDLPGLILTIDSESQKSILYGKEITISDLIWSGPQQSLKSLAEKAGIDEVKPLSKLKPDIENSLVHFLIPYQKEIVLLIKETLNITIEQVRENASVDLAKAIIKQRIAKEAIEVEQIEKAFDEITGPMHMQAMKDAVDGKRESEIVSRMHQRAHAYNCQMSFPPICSIRGETLHNTTYLNILGKNDLLLVDAGAEGKMHYATDMTRTTPVNGNFTQQQKEIYSIVLKAQQKCIVEIKAGVIYRDIHLLASKIIAQGLIDIGIIKSSNADEIVEEGIHALFFPHGVGHLLGLDVHDMENLGEDLVGYDDTIRRSSLFGLANLRFAKKVDINYVLTVEPGIYFIPALIQKWKENSKYKNLLNFNEIGNYSGFGGIRIEDTVLVQKTSARILGKPIPKTIQEIETL